MPSSSNRRRIEIPATLYDELAARAAREGTTVAALATRLLGSALASDSATSAALDDLRAEVRSLGALLRATLPLAPVVPAPPALDPRGARRAKRQLIDELRRERELDRDGHAPEDGGTR